MSRWATVGFAILAVVLGFVAAVGALAALQIMMPAYKLGDANGTTIAVFSLIFNLVQIVTLMLASRRSGTDALVYLGLDIPRWRHIGVAMAGLAVFIVVGDILMLAFDNYIVPPWMLEIRRSAQADGSLVWMWLTLIVAAPIGEELLFRGFMLRGFVHAPRDAIPGIVLVSLIWSLGHTQYGWLDIAEIFVFGLLLGWVRWRTGSTTLTILLHMVSNLETSIETEFALG
jgi:membrane protease YdiL (CAAX protease family)